MAKKKKKESAPKKGGRDPILKLESVKASITRNYGNITNIANELGVQRASVHVFIRNNPDLEPLIALSREAMVDQVENRFYQDCLKDEPAYQTSRIFFLKCQGKRRGYIEKQQIEYGEMNTTEVHEEIIATRPDPTDTAASPVPG